MMTMTVIEYILVIVGSLFALPVASYIIMKFGAAGFYRGKETAKKLNDELKRKQ